MATLQELIDLEQIVRWDVSLRLRQQPNRFLLLMPRLAARLNDLLQNAQSTWNIEETPAQQVDALTADFVAGEPLVYRRQFRNLVHHRDGVWYLKTADVRLFGWFPHLDCFVAGAVGIADQVKRSNLYPGFANEVARDRDLLPLDEPKFVQGDDPNAVVSNFSYPL